MVSLASVTLQIQHLLDTRFMEHMMTAARSLGESKPPQEVAKVIRSRCSHRIFLAIL